MLQRLAELEVLGVTREGTGWVRQVSQRLGLDEPGWSLPVVFQVPADAPTDDELHALLQTIIARLMSMLSRRGVLIEEMDQTYLAELDADGEQGRTLRPSLTASPSAPAPGRRC